MDQNNVDHDLVAVHVCEDDSEAEIIVDFLSANGIEAMVDSDMPHSVLPVEGDARVLVNHSDAEEARRLLATRETEDMEDINDMDDTDDMDESEAE